MRSDEFYRERVMSIEDDNLEPVLPVIKGDWVETVGETHPRVARVVESFWNVEPNGARVCMVNLSIYAHSGQRIGRESPAEGGPTAYEPWIRYTGEWQRVKKPSFPVSLAWMPEGEDGLKVARYVTNAERIGDRLVAPRKVARSGGRVIPKPAGSDYDPELEVRTRRMAAQELRDINRATPMAALVEKAERLEAEASRIAREYGMEK